MIVLGKNTVEVRFSRHPLRRNSKIRAGERGSAKRVEMDFP